MSKVLTFSGKEIIDMSYAELKNEIRLQKWFAKRVDRAMYYIKYNIATRQQALDESTKGIEAEEAYKRGEITELRMRQIKNGLKQTQTLINKKAQTVEFANMHIDNARAIAAACEDMLQYREKPKKRVKNRYNPRVKWSKRHPRKRDVKVNEKQIRFIAWQKKIDSRPNGELWDSDKFFAICADRGYGSQISVQHMVSEALDMPMRQTEQFMKKGCFTWGQVLILGAELEMTPREFADTFLSGYFREIAEDDFRADIEFIPKVLYGESDDK